MIVNRIEPCSLVNGDGCRMVIVFAGCSLGCKGCFSKELQSFKAGKKARADLIALEMAKEVNDTKMLDGVTLSGGNPQEQPDLAGFLKVLRKAMRKTATIWMWSGFTWEEIQANKPFKKHLEFIDVVISGRFEEDKYIEHEYYGSSNQEVWRKIEKEWVKDE